MVLGAAWAVRMVCTRLPRSLAIGRGVAASAGVGGGCAHVTASSQLVALGEAVRPVSTAAPSANLCRARADVRVLASQLARVASRGSDDEVVDWTPCLDEEVVDVDLGGSGASRGVVASLAPLSSGS